MSGGNEEIAKQSKRRRRKRSARLDSYSSDESSAEDFHVDASPADLPSGNTPLESMMKRRKSNGELLDDFEALNSDSDSDCSNTEHENCSICLLRLGRQNIGTPSTCRHRFCLECILEWSCSNNTCPVDRQIFNIINVYNKHKEKENNKVRVTSIFVKSRSTCSANSFKPNKYQAPSELSTRSPCENLTLSSDKRSSQLSQIGLLETVDVLSESDAESECVSGAGIVVRNRRRPRTSRTRRRLAQKGLLFSANPFVPNRQQQQQSSTSPLTLIESIMRNEELHRLSENMAMNLSNVDCRIETTNECAPLDLTRFNQSDVNQAPMYNNNSSPRGSGNRGNFRGGYRDNQRHSTGNQSYANRGSGYSGGNGRNSYGGGGGGGGNRDNQSFSAPVNYSPSNMENRGQPPPLFGNSPFRGRNPHNFRNRFPIADRPPFDGNERPPPLPFSPQGRFRGPEQQQQQQQQGIMPASPMLGPPPLMQQRIQDFTQNRPLLADFCGTLPPPPPPPARGPLNNYPEDSSSLLLSTNLSVNSQVEPLAPSSCANDESEECDLYDNIVQPRHAEESEATTTESQGNKDSSALLPPPEPPSGLLDFEGNTPSDKDSDHEELVIDDQPKEDASSKANSNDDKYDPFATADSDSNDSARDSGTKGSRKSGSGSGGGGINSVASMDFSSSAAVVANEKSAVVPPRLTAYDDDDAESEDEECRVQADCPNFSIYSSATMDVVRNTKEELSEHIGPLEPPPLPPDMPDDEQVFPKQPTVTCHNVVAAASVVAPESTNRYVEALQRERRTLSKIPPKKILHDRGKITFKIGGSKMRLNNAKLSNLYDEIDESIESSLEQETKVEEKRPITDSTAIEVEQQADSSDKMESHASESENLPTTTEVVDKSTSDAIKIAESETADCSAEPSVKTVASSDNDEEKGRASARDSDVSQSDSEDHSEDNDKKSRGGSSPPRKGAANVESEEEELSDDSEGKRKSSSERAAVEPVVLQGEENSLSPGDKRGESRESEQQPHEETRLSRRSQRSPSTDVDDENPVDENFPLEKDDSSTAVAQTSTTAAAAGGGAVPLESWDSDGGYTPCRDNMPPLASKASRSSCTPSPCESGLEPITPTKERNDDLDRCVTPVGYAGLDTEAISETDETNFDEEVTAARREKDVEEGEIQEDGSRGKAKSAAKESGGQGGGGGVGRRDREGDAKQKSRRGDRRDKSTRDSDKNKENISNDNSVSWKKLSKSNKDRQYREKRSRSKDRDRRKKSKEKQVKKKERRKELPRYDVRKIVSEKPPRPRKDEYGRDIREKSRSDSGSRSRSVTPRGARSRSRSPRQRISSRSLSRTRRSVSRMSRSLSRSRRSQSPRSRRKSPRRRSISRRRTPSRRRSRSPSRGGRRRGSLTPPPRRRSASPRRRSPGSPRRRPVARKRRSASRSRDNKRKQQQQQQESSSSSNKLKRRRSRSRTPPRNRNRSRSKRRHSRSAERSKRTKRKATKSRSRERSLSRAPREARRSWDELPNNLEASMPAARQQQQQPPEEQQWTAREGQWTPSWSRSRSRSKTPQQSVQHQQQQQQGMLPYDAWSPPPGLENVVDVSPKNLTVILTNKEAIKKKKKEKRKERKRSREVEKRKRAKRARTPPSSKEVFASGDNILVSVCFNKETTTTDVTGTSGQQEHQLLEAAPINVRSFKRRRRESALQSAAAAAAAEPVKKSKRERKSRDKKSKSPKSNKRDKKKKSRAAEIAATKKPVAVIDLDQSPFREQTPSPRDVIVLSDDEEEKNDEQMGIATPDEQMASSQASPQQREQQQFVSQGPKTPPEPQIKFSIAKQQSNLRASVINPLQEEEEEEEEELEELERSGEGIDERADEELELRAQEELELRLKIGPNTPPEPPTSPPTSPDAYDPFDPTKSRSPTPEPSQAATPSDQRNESSSTSPRKHAEASEAAPGTTGEAGETTSTQEKQPLEKPKVISVVTIKRVSPIKDSSPAADNQAEPAKIREESSPSSKSQSTQQQTQQQNNSTANPFATMNPVLATVAAAVQRSSIFNANATSNTPRALLQPNRISPSTQTKQRPNDRPTLPNLFPKSTPTKAAKSSQNKNISTTGQNGSDANLEIANDTIDMSSPYSPGSSLSDGMFDPPSPGNYSPANVSAPANLPGAPAKNSTPKPNKGEKKDAFDALFGSSPPGKNFPKIRPTKKSSNIVDKRKKALPLVTPKIGVRMDENQLQILDDLPSSAVEMQVKDKYLKKLNRQERVVEEVKLVLKPHYTKKHVTKEEYKDIMRKAVPKICHSKTGEINPKKIAQLIEAYVKKCRIKKKANASASNSIPKIQKPTKNLWS